MFLNKVLDEVDSKINGRIKVVRTLGMGTYFQVDGLTQSGGIISDIWRPIFRKIGDRKLEIGNCLILGLGGGTVAKLVHKNWPEAKITGVDLDPMMIELGKKYLGLDKIPINIKIQDAYDIKSGYDLVIVDLYIGKEFPDKFTSDAFLKKLSTNNLVIFNRLYFGDRKQESIAFGEKLKKYFSKVEIVRPVANMLFICSGLK